jgi:D-lactate dehydrogenase
LEDIVVPVETFTVTCSSLTSLFERYSYIESVIFGHAKDGNVHFMLTETFQGEESLGRLKAVTDDLVDIVLGVGGSLKAEHGTGRMMAPFVQRQ